MENEKLPSLNTEQNIDEKISIAAKYWAISLELYLYYKFGLEDNAFYSELGTSIPYT